MHIDLAGKKALVTGSSAGIGLAIAKGLAACGADIVLHGRNLEKLAQAQSALAQTYPSINIASIASDLATASGAQLIIDAHPRVDILVNNAGFFEQRAFTETSDEQWQRMFDVNVMGGVRLSRHYLPLMLQMDWGRIVFISSESALHIPTEMIHYGVSKTALLGVSRGLAELTKGSGVTVNAVLPGPTRSDGVAEFFAKMSEMQERSQEQVERDFVAMHRPSSLLRRLASVEEVANMVVYTCSREASATNGAALRVDGGVVRTIA